MIKRRSLRRVDAPIYSGRGLGALSPRYGPRMNNSVTVHNYRKPREGLPMWVLIQVAPRQYAISHTVFDVIIDNGSKDPWTFEQAAEYGSFLNEGPKQP